MEMALVTLNVTSTDHQLEGCHAGTVEVGAHTALLTLCVTIYMAGEACCEGHIDCYDRGRPADLSAIAYAFLKYVLGNMIAAVSMSWDCCFVIIQTERDVVAMVQCLFCKVYKH